MRLCDTISILKEPCSLLADLNVSVFSIFLLVQQIIVDFQTFLQWLKCTLYKIPKWLNQSSILYYYFQNKGIIKRHSICWWKLTWKLSFTAKLILLSSDDKNTLDQLVCLEHDSTKLLELLRIDVFNLTSLVVRSLGDYGYHNIYFQSVDLESYLIDSHSLL